MSDQRLEHKTQIGTARALAVLAAHLDEAKFKWPSALHAQVMDCVETMYDMAEVLAGDRADEIIGPSDGSETPRRQAAEPTDCNGGPGWAVL